MDLSRRLFINKVSTIAGFACVGSVSALLSSCKDNGSAFVFVDIISDKCVGCAECLPFCVYKAIDLPERTSYSIITDKCIECGKCKAFCDKNAFEIYVVTYNILEDKCTGCGKCIEKCLNEGNCIYYSKSDYSVKNKCKPNRCRLRCAAICEYDAITIQDQAVIDMTKCTRCGKCVDACEFAAINPAKVAKDESLCNHCGKCLPVCTFEAITKTVPVDYKPPVVNQELCTSCGNCIEACPEYNAININLKVASISRKKCTDCEKCIPSCRYDAIIKQD